MKELTDNELIAEFMGGTYSIAPKGGIHGYKEGTKIWFCLFGSMPDQINHLYYDQARDWLIPAISKFSGLQFDDDFLAIKHSDHVALIAEKVLEFNILGAHEALIDGIKWYNSNGSEENKK